MQQHPDNIGKDIFHPISDFNKIYRTVYGIHGEIHLWPSVNDA
jgi:hypothetical protein